MITVKYTQGDQKMVHVENAENWYCSTRLQNFLLRLSIKFVKYLSRLDSSSYDQNVNARKSCSDYKSCLELQSVIDQNYDNFTLISETGAIFAQD